MEKGLCWASLVVAGIMLLLFILDVIFGFPFGGSALSGMQLVDIFGIVASGILVYLSFNALKDVR